MRQLAIPGLPGKWPLNSVLCACNNRNTTKNETETLIIYLQHNLLQQTSEIHKKSAERPPQIITN